MPKTTQSKRDSSKTGRRRKATIPKRFAVVGISNRKSPAEEAEERRAFEPKTAEPLAPEDAGGDKGERGFTRDGGQTSHKAGARSVAQKEAGSEVFRSIDARFAQGRRSICKGASVVGGEQTPAMSEAVTARAGDNVSFLCKNRASLSHLRCSCLTTIRSSPPICGG